MSDPVESLMNCQVCQQRLYCWTNPNLAKMGHNHCCSSSMAKCSTGGVATLQELSASSLRSRISVSLNATSWLPRYTNAQHRTNLWKENESKKEDTLISKCYLDQTNVSTGLEARTLFQWFQGRTAKVEHPKMKTIFFGWGGSKLLWCNTWKFSRLIQGADFDKLCRVITFFGIVFP